MNFEPMENFDDFDPKKIKFDMKSFRGSKVSFVTRLFLRFWPQKGVIRLAREFGLNTNLTEAAHNLFFKVKRVDIIPSQSGERGFQIILDKDTALYFYQDGDHFVYDGCEMGNYNGGDVTILDKLK